MWQLIDIKTNQVLGTYSDRNSAYRALNRGLNTRFLGRSVFVIGK
jgi:hypothetical protein